MGTQLTFKPKHITKRLLAVLPDRARDIVINRFGLGNDAQVKTLEAIGNQYGITRERVRQIENYALNAIRKSETMKQDDRVFAELAQVVDELGGIVPESEILSHIAKDASTRNHLYFLLELDNRFIREKEGPEFHHRWYLDKTLADQVHDALRRLYQNISDEDLIPESQLIATFLGELKDINEKYRNEEIARRWIGLAKQINKNPLGEWGRADSPNVRAKGMRDYAYLVIKRHGSPLHFREVADAIARLFNKKAHVATCHNELIKDDRFVLVGRGLYALSEWGYTNGVVRDVIANILRQHGPLTREEIVKLVRNERYVKDNTIIVNLQDPRHFKRDSEGRYHFV